MPRSPRLDAPGVLHHVMARGIERRPLFRTDVDRDDFVGRLAGLAEAGGAPRGKFGVRSLLWQHPLLLHNTPKDHEQRPLGSLTLRHLWEQGVSSLRIALLPIPTPARLRA